MYSKARVGGEFDKQKLLAGFLDAKKRLSGTVLVPVNKKGLFQTNKVQIRDVVCDIHDA